MTTLPTFHAPRGKSGCRIKFPNNYVLSIQIGPGTYSDNHYPWCRPPENGWTSNTAETAIQHHGLFVKYKGEDIQPYQTGRQVAETLRHVIRLAGGLPFMDDPNEADLLMRKTGEFLPQVEPRTFQLTAGHSPPQE